jgi:hypothetical protein
MATFTGWYYTGDQPTQEFTFEADKSLRGDIEELETVMRREMRKRFSRSTAENATIENISIELDEEAMLENIIETVKELDRYEDYEAVVDSGTIFFYDDDKLAEVFNAGEALRSAVEQIESSGNDEAEIRYNGLKYFIVNAIY